MYSKGDKIYSDAGKILVSDEFIGYQTSSSSNLNNIREEDVILDDMRISGRYIIYSGGKIKQLYRKNYTYADWKVEIIKWRYSNDDQIALILNKDRSEEDTVLFNRMQEWRTWATNLANKIISLHA